LSLPLAINRVPWAFLPAALLLALACTKPNPDYCDERVQCSGGRLCDLATRSCARTDASPDGPAQDVGGDVAPDTAGDAGLEVRPPDATGTCSTTADCTAPGRPVCINGSCERCTADNQCAHYPDRPVCQTTSGLCVGCVDSVKDCAAAARPICVANACAACGDDLACASRSAATPACDRSGGGCVECTEDRHCAIAGKPICDVQSRKCVRCTADAQCVKKLGMDPGVCMSHEDGRCATAAETVFVQSIPQCATGVGMGMAGTAGMPYCSAQDGITAALAGSRPLVVLRGPTDRWAYSSAGKLTVVGQGGKVVGAGVGVRVSGGELYLRGLTVSASGATGTGVVAENGAILRMNRCLVENNGAGGISVNNAGFDIVNTIIANNDPGETAPGTGITFGGVYLSGAAGKPQRFLNNTVVNNRAIGLYCAAAYAVKGVLIKGNAVREVHQCTTAAGSNVTDPPGFDPMKPYHLTAASPCVDMGDAMESPPDDYDGEPRSDARSDCGADEYRR
jgi:hypothetical protein